MAKKATLYCWQVLMPITNIYDYGVTPADSEEEFIGLIMTEKNIEKRSNLTFHEVPTEVLMNVDTKA